MDKNLQKLDNFFKIDLIIKNIINTSFPSPVDKLSKWAKGKIELSVDNLGSNLYTFVTKIPTDDDMFLKGGLCEEYGSRL